MSRLAKKLAYKPQAKVIQKSLQYYVVPLRSALKVVSDALGADQAITFSKKSAPSVELFLARSGELYRHHREQFSAAFKGDRSALLEIFMENGNEYVPTATLLKGTDYANNRSLYKAIEEINAIARGNLKLDVKLIESGNGFRINPAYKIIRSKE